MKQNANPRLRVPVINLAQGTHPLEKDAAHYVVNVHRLGIGDMFHAFDPALATEADATIITIQGGCVTLQISALRTASRRPPKAVTLFQGVPKGSKSEAIVRDATELGATEIVFVRCARSQGSAPLRHDRLLRIAREAARQSGRSDLPGIVGPILFGALSEIVGPKIVMVPNADLPLASAWPPDCSATSLLIGPEGGFSEEEVRSLAKWGFAQARLGPFVMRTETAASAALGAFWAHVDALPHAATTTGPAEHARAPNGARRE